MLLDMWMLLSWILKYGCCRSPCWPGRQEMVGSYLFQILSWIWYWHVHYLGSPEKLCLRALIKFQISSHLKTSFLTLRSRVIYKFTCESCNASYIGSTRQKFKTRIFQHLRNFRQVQSSIIKAPSFWTS